MTCEQEVAKSDMSCLHLGTKISVGDYKMDSESSLGEFLRMLRNMLVFAAFMTT